MLPNPREGLLPLLLSRSDAPSSRMRQPVVIFRFERSKGVGQPPELKTPSARFRLFGKERLVHASNAHWSSATSIVHVRRSIIF